MREVNIQGVKGFQFDTIQEAWDAHYTAMHGKNPISGEAYHYTYQAFLSGIISGLNIASVKYGDNAGPDVPIREAIAKALIDTLSEATGLVSEEFINTRGKQ